MWVEKLNENLKVVLDWLDFRYLNKNKCNFFLKKYIFIGFLKELL